MNRKFDNSKADSYVLYGTVLIVNRKAYESNEWMEKNLDQIVKAETIILRDPEKKSSFIVKFKHNHYDKNIISMVRYCGLSLMETSAYVSNRIEFENGLVQIDCDNKTIFISKGTLESMVDVISSHLYKNAYLIIGTENGANKSVIKSRFAIGGYSINELIELTSKFASTEGQNKTYSVSVIIDGEINASSFEEASEIISKLTLDDLKLISGKIITSTDVIECDN